MNTISIPITWMSWHPLITLSLHAVMQLLSSAPISERQWERPGSSWRCRRDERDNGTVQVVKHKCAIQRYWVSIDYLAHHRQEGVRSTDALDPQQFEDFARVWRLRHKLPISTAYTEFGSGLVYADRRNRIGAYKLHKKLSYCCDSRSYCMQKYDRLNQLLRDTLSILTPRLTYIVYSL